MTEVASGNLFADLPAATAEEQVLTLTARPGARVERIVSTGQASPPGFWYDQAEDEFVVLLAGEALLTIEGRAAPLRLTPGSWVDLPARCRHRVEWTQADPPTVWLAVFMGDLSQVRLASDLGNVSKASKVTGYSR